MSSVSLVIQNHSEVVISSTVILLRSVFLILTGKDFTMQYIAVWVFVFVF